MDVLKRIRDLAEQRRWSINHLAKQAGLSQSTLSGLFIRNNNPTIPTLERICDAFGITISEFFTPDGDMVNLTEEQKQLLDKWNSLSKKHKTAILQLIDSL